MIYIPSDNFSFRVDVYNTVPDAVLTCKVYGEEDTPYGTVPYLDSFNIIPNVTDASLYSSERRTTKKGVRVQAVNVVYTGSGNVQRGQIFVRGMMFYGDTDTIPAVVLFSDYVTSNNSPGYPGSGLVDSLSGRGYFVKANMTVDSSAKFATYDQTGNFFSKVLTVSANFTLSATPGDRSFTCGVSGYGTTGMSQQLYTASEEGTVTFSLITQSSKQQDLSAGGDYNVGIESLSDSTFMDGAASFGISIYNNDDDADAISGAFVVMERLIKA